VITSSPKITGMSLEAESTQLAVDLRPILRAGAPRVIADLAAMVRIPSVSWAGFDASHVDATAQYVMSRCEEIGLFDQVGVYRHGDGAPAVVARREPAAGAPTVVLYAHHDVQPPGDDSLWDTPAYEPSVRHGRLYGRGSADDKAGIAVHLAALRALKEHASEDIRLGIVMFIEGEEENGSPSFEGFLREHHDLLRGDVMVVADSDNPSTTIPAITTSLRGNVTAVVTIRTLDHAVHSGMLGGAVPDAMMAWSVVAASFYEPDGSVAIDGLHSAPAHDEKEPSTVGDEAGLLPGVREIGQGSVWDRLWRMPALTITGIDAPGVMEASNTLIPEVRVKLSLRVAPGDTAARAAAALERHIESAMPFGATWSLTDVSLGEPFVVDTRQPAFALARASAKAGFRHTAVDQGVGGSIPFISQLSSAFPEAQIVVTGIEDPDTRAHSPNESLDLGVLWRQALTESVFLGLLNHRSRSDLTQEPGVE